MLPQKTTDSYIAKVYSASHAVFWDRFNLYGLQSFLILYLGAAFGFLDKANYTFFGTYTALSFAFTVLGGFIADRLLGSYYAALVGGALIICANLILCIPHIEAVYIGLSFMVVGIGLLKPNNPNLLGMIYKEDSLDRTKAYSTFYVGISLGSIIGPLIYGLAYTSKYYWCGFALSAIGILAACLYLRKYKSSFAKLQTNLSISKLILIIGSCILVSLLLIRHNQVFGYFMSGVVVVFLLFAFMFLKKMARHERLAVLSLLSPFLSGIFFFTAFLQLYSSITLFVERYVDRHVFLGWEIPATWFSSIEPFCILFMVVILNYVWRILSKRNINPSSQTKVIIGLFFCCSSFLVFCLTTQLLWLNHYFIFLLLFMANTLLATGELCIVPVTMSLINIVSPSNYTGTLMGVFYFTLTFSGYLSGWIAKISPATAIASPTNSTHLFLLISGLLFVAAILLMLLNGFMPKNKIGIPPEKEIIPS